MKGKNSCGKFGEREITSIVIRSILRQLYLFFRDVRGIRIPENVDDDTLWVVIRTVLRNGIRTISHIIVYSKSKVELIVQHDFQFFYEGVTLKLSNTRVRKAIYTYSWDPFWKKE